MKTAYALIKNGKMVDCFFARSKAVRQVDEHLGNGLFAPKWDGNVKGEYEIIPCKVEYGKLYTIPRKEGIPRMFASIEEVTDLLKEKGVKVKKKNVRSTTFDIETERGTVRGKIVQVR